MALSLSDYFNILNSSAYKTKARVTFLRLEDETPHYTIQGDIMNGNLQITRENGVRRSCNLTLTNEKKEYIPNPYNLWVNTKFFLELGVESPEAPGEVFYLPQGVFVLRNPQVLSERDHSTISLSGSDKFSLLDGQLGGRLDGTYLIEVDTDLHFAIRSILSTSLDENAQLPIDGRPPILQDLPEENKTTPYTLRQELGGNLGDILLELNGMVSRNMYYNPLGHFVFEEDFDDEIKGPLWRFSENNFTYLGSTHEYKFEELFNKVIVVSDNVDGYIHTAMAVNNNPASKTSVNAIGVKIADIITDNVIYSEELADLRARYELKKLNALQSAISLKSIPMFHLDVDKAITLTDSKLDLNEERFIIQDINIPLGFGQEMTLSAVQSSELDF